MKTLLPFASFSLPNGYFHNLAYRQTYVLLSQDLFFYPCHDNSSLYRISDTPRTPTHMQRLYDFKTTSIWGEINNHA